MTSDMAWIPTVLAIEYSRDRGVVHNVWAEKWQTACSDAGPQAGSQPDTADGWPRSDGRWPFPPPSPGI